MPTFRVDAGNSTDGPVGFVLVLKADSRGAALEKARALLPDTIEAATACDPDVEIEYFNVYISPETLTLDDAEEIEDA